MTELPRVVPTTPTPPIRPVKRGRKAGREPRKRREDDAPSSKHEAEPDDAKPTTTGATETPGTTPAEPSDEGATPESDAPPRVNIRV